MADYHHQDDIRKEDAGKDATRDEDLQLLHRTSLDDKDALEDLYTRYSTPVYSLAMFVLKHQALAEEATQDIFLNIWLKAGSFKADRGAPKAWLHHKIIDVIRAR